MYPFQKYQVWWYDSTNLEYSGRTIKIWSYHQRFDPETCKRKVKREEQGCDHSWLECERCCFVFTAYKISTCSWMLLIFACSLFFWISALVSAKKMLSNFSGGRDFTCHWFMWWTSKNLDYKRYVTPCITRISLFWELNFSFNMNWWRCWVIYVEINVYMFPLSVSCKFLRLVVWAVVVTRVSRLKHESYQLVKKTL